MTRSWKGARNRQSMAQLATVKAINARYSVPETGARIERAVYRVTGERIRSSAVFPAMGIRPVEGMPSRGQWLTGRAMSEAASTGAPPANAGKATLRDKPVPVITLATMRRELRRVTARVNESELLLATWVANDAIIHLALFDGMQERYLRTGDFAAFVAEVDQLDLAREATREWSGRMLAEIQAGNIAADRVRALIEQRRSPAVHERRALTVADFPLWDTHTLTPVKTARVAPVAVTVAAPVTDRAEALMHGNKFFTRGDV